MQNLRAQPDAAGEGARAYTYFPRQLEWQKKRPTLQETMKYVVAIPLLLATALAQAPAKPGALAPASSPAQTSNTVQPPHPIPVAKPLEAKPLEDESTVKARALVGQAIEALGGPAYVGYTARTEQGRSYTLYHGRPRDGGVMYRRFFRYADKDRVEIPLESYGSMKDIVQTQNPFPIDLPDPRSNKKTDVAIIHNGEQGYEITFKGTEKEEPKLTADYNRRSQRSLDKVLREWIREPGTALFYEGQSLADNKLADQITITNPQNESVTLFLDAVTHLPIKKTYSWRDTTDKYRNVEDEVYDNYKPVQGILTPYSVTRYYNGDMAYQRFLSKITYNENLADSLFEASLTK